MPCRYAISLVFHLPTDADTVPSSKPRPRTQKQMQKEMERLTRELQLMTSQRNELRDHVIFITEGKVDDRYPLFQTSWTVSNVPSPALFKGLGLHSAIPLELVGAHGLWTNRWEPPWDDLGPLLVCDSV